MVAKLLKMPQLLFNFCKSTLTFEERLIYNVRLLQRLYLLLFTLKINKTCNLPRSAKAFAYNCRSRLTFLVSQKSFLDRGTCLLHQCVYIMT